MKDIGTNKEIVGEIAPDLPNKPLVEAIFELHWELRQPVAGPLVEPEYLLLFARLYSSLQESFPEYNPLEIAKAGVHFPWVVEHQFKAKSGWPLVQLGPGIISINETEGYTWGSFQKTVQQVIRKVFEIWGEGSPALKTISLRYIDAIEVDFDQTNPLGFLKDKLKVAIELPEVLFQKYPINPKPSEFDIRLAHTADELFTVIDSRFVSGQIREKSALIWETGVRHTAPSKLTGAESIFSWLAGAHGIVDYWFFNLMEGDLLQQFKKERE